MTPSMSLARSAFAHSSTRCRMTAAVATFSSFTGDIACHASGLRLFFRSSGARGSRGHAERARAAKAWLSRVRKRFAPGERIGKVVVVRDGLLVVAMPQPFACALEHPFGDVSEQQPHGQAEHEGRAGQHNGMFVGTLHHIEPAPADPAV